MNFYVKTTLVVFTLILTSFRTTLAQTPSTCFEIESILVDACGSPEGENEMVRFAVGPSNLNVNNLTVNWPNNSFLGICQNATTAAKIFDLNSSIIGCGLLLEPTANILPAGSRVILLTSTNFDVAANSFANLNDTLYVIFQCAGNTAGHFANYSTSGLRTLNMSFSSPSGCSDAVTYNRALLVNPSGIPMASDGGRVDFNWNNSPSYNNDGCTAPINLNNVVITSPSPTICPGDVINLSANIIGSFQSVNWYGGLGSFSNANSNSTNYNSSINDNSNFYIYFEGVTTCGLNVTDSLLIQIGANASNINITSSTTELCNGDSILLTATGSGNYTWNTGSNASTIYASNAGTYYATSTTGCGSSIDSITITNAAPVNLTLSADNISICQGGIATLTAAGAQNYTWFNSSTGTSTTVNTSGDYYVIGYNNCYQDSQSIAITVIQQPNLILSASNSSLCNGNNVTLTAAGSNNYIWNTSDTNSSIIVSAAGIYTVSTSNSCFTVSDSITITQGVSPIASIIGDSIICNNQSIQLTATGGSNYLWSNGSQNSTVNFSGGGPIYVIVSNSCGADTAYHTINNYGVNASFTSDFVYGSEAPITINFTNTSTNALYYNWDFGDGGSSTLENPSNTFLTNKKFNVVLVVSNEYCSDSYEETLLFESPNTIYIPNVFTPNNDGINDVFSLKGDNIMEIKTSIFNRWGENIYNWETIDGYWDGTYKNKLVADGTYFYLVEVLWNNNEKEKLSGSITKLR